MIVPRRAALALVAASGGLRVLAGLRMPVPSGLAWAEVDQWYLEVGPTVAAMSSLRLAGLVASGWLLVASGLQLLVACGSRPHLQALADRIAPHFLRPVACGAVALSLGVGLGDPAAAEGPPPGTAVMVPLDPPPTTSRPTTTTTSSATSTTTSPAVSSSTTTTAPPATTPTPRDAALPSPSPGRALAEGEVVVEAGGSFWSIAEEEAGERQVEPYWRALIELNRGRLVDPTNPDLLYPGQVLRLP